MAKKPPFSNHYIPEFDSYILKKALGQDTKGRLLKYFTFNTVMPNSGVASPAFKTMGDFTTPALRAQKVSASSEGITAGERGMTPFRDHKRYIMNRAQVVYRSSV